MVELKTRINSQFAVLGILLSLSLIKAHASPSSIEPVQACIILPNETFTSNAVRTRFAHCLGWEERATPSICHGSYRPIHIASLANSDEIQIMAKEVSLYHNGLSKLIGDVEVQQTGRIVNAQTAYVYRDSKSQQITKIELVGNVQYLEEDRLMIAQKVSINPKDKSGRAEEVLYRFNNTRHAALLPAWGRATLIERLMNKNYNLYQATYSHCAPQDHAWQIEAESINLDYANETGVARHAKLRIGDLPIFYTPYLSFPTSKKRKSGFLMPIVGNTNVSGFDLALPYYWNMAPNYDATITPHLYTLRGLMLGSEFRYLTTHSLGMINGNFLPEDRAFNRFLSTNEAQYPSLQNLSSNRWSFGLIDGTDFTSNLHLGINYQQVSDSYYLQDFSSTFTVMTERQLLHQGDLTYTTDNWLFRGMLESYQTLNAIDETPLNNVYQRLPQLLASGNYIDLPFNGTLSILGQFDNYRWPNLYIPQPQGPRLHIDPLLSFPQIKPWGYYTPSIELVENYYQVTHNGAFTNSHYNRAIPRYSLDGGLYFERSSNLMGKEMTQTFEPHLYYLYVPFQNQAQIPIYDSSYMIFIFDQLFRANRFSGYDRIGDSNQISYAASSRWLSNENGAEKASLSIGQIAYFSNRRVQLCQNPTGFCIQDPLALGFLSPISTTSPIATHGNYQFNPRWGTTADYVWDPATRATNNTTVTFHYQPELNHIINMGYTYLLNGDITANSFGLPLQTSNSQGVVLPNGNPLHQATVAYAWPFNANWSSLGAYNYNISKNYEMASFLGLQYDNCCWALRLVGGRSFKSLSQQLSPQYNNNIYFQVLLKGLGSAAYSDPERTIHTYLPGYVDHFHS